MDTLDSARWQPDAECSPILEYLVAQGFTGILFQFVPSALEEITWIGPDHMRQGPYEVSSAMSSTLASGPRPRHFYAPGRDKKQRFIVQVCPFPPLFVNVCHAENEVQEPFIKHPIEVGHVHFPKHDIDIWIRPLEGLQHWPGSDEFRPETFRFG